MNIHAVYITLAVIFACFVGYMFFYSMKRKLPKRTAQRGSTPLGSAEIVAAPGETERTNDPGNTF